VFEFVFKNAFHFWVWKSCKV